LKQPIATVKVMPGADLHGIVPDGEYVLVLRHEWEDATSSFGYMQKKIAALQERIRVLNGGDPQPEAGGEEHHAE
jgi:hypothetical protein